MEQRLVFMHDVVVFDENPKRRAALSEALPRDSPAYFPRCNKKAEPTLVCLLHYGDSSQPLALEVCEKTTLVVYFGGNGEPDSRWGNDLPRGTHGKERVWRKIATDGTGALTSIEVQELVGYAKSLKEDKRMSVPLFLQPCKKRSTLIALFILCQGYLAINDPEKVGIRPSGIISDTTGVSTLDSPSWWLGIFLDDMDKAKRSSIERAIEELRKSVASEWVGTDKNRRPVDDLIRSFLSGVKIRDVVPGAFAAIKFCLENQNESDG